MPSKLIKKKAYNQRFYLKTQEQTAPADAGQTSLLASFFEKVKIREHLGRLMQLTLL